MNKMSVPKAMLVHWALYGLIVLLIIVIGFAITYTHQRLVGFAKEVDHLKIDSEINEQSIGNAQRLQRALDQNKDSVARAASIVADTKYYEYQDQIVQDITSYANVAGLTVLGFDFTSANQTVSKNNVAGLKTVVASVSLKNPVQYSNYLRFLKLIEKNLTKMQITKLDITNDLKSPTTINSQLVTIEVYVR